MTDADFKYLITVLLLIIFIGGIMAYYIFLLIKLKAMDQHKSDAKISGNKAFVSRTIKGGV